MSFELLTRVVLKEDLPQYDLKKGDVATIIEYHPSSNEEEDGYSLEGFDTVADNIIKVKASQIEPLEI